MADHRPQYLKLDALLTVSETAKLLRVCNNTIWAMIRDGELETVMVRRSRRIPARALAKFGVLVDAQEGGRE